jgi:hypothetical protein
MRDGIRAPSRSLSRTYSLRGVFVYFGSGYPMRGMIFEPRAHKNKNFRKEVFGLGPHEGMVIELHRALTAQEHTPLGELFDDLYFSCKV